MAAVQQLSVYSPEQIDQAIRGYIAQGFVVMNRTRVSATMFKKKEFSILWLVVGLILCVIPLLIYLIVYAIQSDQMVEIRLIAAPAIAVPAPPAGGSILSDDGRHWLDGQQSQPVPLPGSGLAAPPSAALDPFTGDTLSRGDA